MNGFFLVMSAVLAVPASYYTTRWILDTKVNKLKAANTGEEAGNYIVNEDIVFSCKEEHFLKTERRKS